MLPADPADMGLGELAPRVVQQAVVDLVAVARPDAHDEVHHLGRLGPWGVDRHEHGFYRRCRHDQ
jgi:hypothetical protein